MQRHIDMRFCNFFLEDENPTNTERGLSETTSPPECGDREDGMACLKPNAVCDQAADQQEEVVGCCGCVRFFRMLISPLFIKYINIKLSACLVSSDFIYQIK